MPKLPLLSGFEIIKILSKFGFQKIRQKGSHAILECSTSSGKSHCVVPLYDEIDRPLLANILRQAQISREDFLKYV